MRDIYIIGEAGAGLVKVTYRNGVPFKVEIDDLVFKETDKQLVSELFVAALMDTEKKLIEEARSKYSNKYPTINDIINYQDK